MYDMKWFVVGLMVAGCASAGKGNSIIGGLSDAGVEDPGQPDAAQDDARNDPVSDALTQQLTLTQTRRTTITDGNSFACMSSSGATAQNSYYRVFALDDFDITTPLHVTQVDFGIERADAGSNATAQPATIKIGTYGANPVGTTLDPAQIVPNTEVAVMIPDGRRTRMTVPIEVDAAPGSRLIVELNLPDGTNTDSHFLIGSNADGERQPGYLSATAAGCQLDVPTTMQSVAASLMRDDADILLTVTGTL